MHSCAVTLSVLRQACATNSSHALESYRLSAGSTQRPPDRAAAVLTDEKLLDSIFPGVNIQVNSLQEEWPSQSWVSK